MKGSNHDQPKEIKAETGGYKLMGGGVSFGLKRGDISWAYFPIAYAIILTITIGIIQLIEILYWPYRILLIIIFASLFFYFCFFNNWLRTKIVGLFSKSKEHIERR
jgi:hypothetical protein